jgi:peptidase E
MIIATSMGFNRSRAPWEPGPVFSFAFDLAHAGREGRLCYVGTATGDQQDSIERFYSAFAGSTVRCSHLALFDKPNVADVREHLLKQDVIWVDRGSVANLLAVWRAHAVDRILRECWEAGVVLAGESAGSLCWHTSGLTDSFGALRAFSNGLGLIPHSNSVHYSQRRDEVRAAIGRREIPAGYATDAGAGIVYRGVEFLEALADRSNSGAFWLEGGDDGTVVERPLAVRRLKR